jgi:hypothetical protein
MNTAIKEIKHGITDIKLEPTQSAIIFDADGENMTAYLPDVDPEQTMDISVAVVMAFAAQATPTMRALYNAAYQAVADELDRFEAGKNAAAG